MRILDVGCSNAGITHHIAKDVEGLVVDGLDLDRRMVALANRRARKQDIPGKFKVGSALDAPNLFKPGTYDAVVAFELIEHVPDVTEFLATLEAMVKPGGRVYISTPDGTFGQGNNPHHLRVYKAVDLADTIRRRGHLQDLTVGSDQVTVVSYTPGPRREDIGIYLGPCWNRWSPMDIMTKGLGGSETAAVRLADALNDMGFIVTVYGDTDDTCIKDVIYRHYSRFDPLEPRGALIASRAPEVADRPIAAATRLLWVHDIDCGDRLTGARGEAFDHILALSPFHAAHLRGRYPWLAPKVVETRNGIHTKYFKPLPWTERDPRVVYSSSPDRGLDVLLELWPRVLEQVPDAQLAYCYADVYDAVADKDPVIGAFRDRVKALSDQPGVERLGALSQPLLSELMCSSRVWAHPSYSTPAGMVFHETSCIGAMEAQAAGCLVVATDVGALHDTVKIGRLVNNGVLSDSWKAGMVQSIVSGLSDQRVGEWAVTAGPSAASDLGWDGVAEQIGLLVAVGDTAPVRAR